jgi:hypothetical protein
MKGGAEAPAPRPKAPWLRLMPAATAVLIAVSLAACDEGGSSSSPPETTPPPVNNVQPVIVDAGPAVNGQAVGEADVLFTTVTARSIIWAGITPARSIGGCLSFSAAPFLLGSKAKARPRAWDPIGHISIACSPAPNFP